PSVPEIAAFLRLDRDRVAQATLAANAYRSVSLYTPVGDAGLAPVDRLGESDAELDSIELRESIAPLLRQLSRRDKQIVAMRFYGNPSQAQIAAQPGLDRAGVRVLRTGTEPVAVGVGPDAHHGTGRDSRGRLHPTGTRRTVRRGPARRYRVDPGPYLVARVHVVPGVALQHGVHPEA